jgi:hypothetical protein
VEWDKWYDALVAHGKEYGSCNVHRLKQYPLQDGSNRMVKLGEWVRHVIAPSLAHFAYHVISLFALRLLCVCVG